FQAEDGIRDDLVTGVQTCALPISIIAVLVAMLLPTLRRARDQARAIQCQSNLRQIGVGFFNYAIDNHDHIPPVGNANTYWTDNRSEERRVGKECRHRMSPAKSSKQ